MTHSAHSTYSFVPAATGRVLLAAKVHGIKWLTLCCVLGLASILNAQASKPGDDPAPPLELQENRGLSKRQLLTGELGDLERLAEGEILFFPRSTQRAPEAKHRALSPLGSLTKEGLMDIPPLVTYPEAARVAWEQSFGRIKKVDDTARKLGEKAFVDYPRHPLLAIGVQWFAGTPIRPGLMSLGRLAPKIRWEILGELEHSLGNTLAQLGMTGKAERYLMRAAVVRTRNLGERHLLTRSSYLSLLQLYQARDEPGRVKYYRKKLGLAPQPTPEATRRPAS